MYKNLSTDEVYPKTLVIRNTKGGLIWQVYNVEREKEAILLSINATKNGYECITLVDFDDSLFETYPDWRSTDGGKEIINKSKDYV